MKHDDTRIYRRSLELVALSKAVNHELPVGYGFLVDQLRRASSSVALNFSEGYSKPSPREQRRFFNIARASAYEVAAIFDVAYAFDVIRPEHHERGRDICDHIAAMITRFRR
jgi:four helix bundle protein